MNQTELPLQNLPQKFTRLIGSKAADLEVEAPIHKSRKKKKTSFPISVPPEKSRQISNPTPKSFNQPIITKSHTNLRFSTHKLKSRPRIKSQNPQNAPTIPNRRNQTASSRLSGSQIPRIPLKNNKNQKKKKIKIYEKLKSTSKRKKKKKSEFRTKSSNLTFGTKPEKKSRRLPLFKDNL